MHHGSDECNHSDYCTNQYKVYEKTKGRETIRFAILAKKTYLGFVAPTSIALIDIIYSEITLP